MTHLALIALYQLFITSYSLAEAIQMCSDNVCVVASPNDSNGLMPWNLSIKKQPANKVVATLITLPRVRQIAIDDMARKVCISSDLAVVCYSFDDFQLVYFIDKKLLGAGPISLMARILLTVPNVIAFIDLDVSQETVFYELNICAVNAPTVAARREETRQQRRPVSAMTSRAYCRRTSLSEPGFSILDLAQYDESLFAAVFYTRADYKDAYYEPEKETILRLACWRIAKPEMLWQEDPPRHISPSRWEEIKNDVVKQTNIEIIIPSGKMRHLVENRKGIKGGLEFSKGNAITVSALGTTLACPK
jgi:hypothetical protein